MARPQKIGLDYFNLDTVFSDDKIDLMEAECGLAGFAILIKLWQKIYLEGYYIDWEEDNAILFSRNSHADITLIRQVVDVSLKRKIFSQELHDKYKILTSRGIQKRYLTIYKQIRRSYIPMIKEYLLVNDLDLISVITELTSINAELTPKNTEEIQQSKVKESKEEESIIMPPISPKGESDNDSNKDSSGESLLVETATGEPNKVSPSKTRKVRKKTELSATQRIRFDKFWSIWPNKVSRGQAETTWAKLDPDEKFTEEIIAGVKRTMKYDRRFTDGFMPHASTWLNAKGWLDEFEIKGGSGDGRNSGNTSKSQEGTKKQYGTFL